MSAFEFEVVDKRDQAIRGVDTAANVAEMADRLRRGGFTIIDIREQRNVFSSLVQKLGFDRRLPLYPTIVVVQLVEAGEQSGELSTMLLRLGDFFEEEVTLSLAVFTSLLEPAMIAIMGSIVMFVLVAVFQPVYQLMSLF